KRPSANGTSSQDAGESVAARSAKRKKISKLTKQNIKQNIKPTPWKTANAVGLRANQPYFAHAKTRPDANIC
ncbi:hypothetical protein, partial [Xaviernesmea oryzae]|uniref:hypothetical protein n=1 Tax=Xaviernesmea oryzae TaxID=464029 RepID=UPI001AEC8A0A